ncbi:MAG: Two-component system sensor histidine kinase [uncultured Cytophagales bacterium]|uniref:histidine kinase n=1 Tax=uncultured Cytophagales bacterium TaxID=158755 RepID=A0A6J4LRY2_9SPHI|nr:MAG: Two-component system sensor histidine kinase [uncultured Cytophagales bacterium]
MRYPPALLFLPGLLLLAALATPAEAQPVTLAQADSLRQRLKEGREDPGQVATLLRLGEFYLRKTPDPNRGYDSALVLAGQAGALSTRLGDARGREEAVFLRGKIFVKRQQADRVLAMLDSVSDTNRIRLLLELGKHLLRPTYTRDADRDAAIALFRRAEKLSQAIGSGPWREESLSLIGVSYLLKGDRARGKANFTEVIEARRRAGDKAGEIRALLRFANTTFCEDCRENLQALSRALALARQLGDRPREALILVNMGHFQRDDGNLEAALREAQRAFDIQQVIGYPALNRAAHELADESVYMAPMVYAALSNVNYLLAGIYERKGDLNKRLFYLLEATRDAQRDGMTGELDYAYAMLAAAYLELGQYDKSTEYFQRSFTLSQQKGREFLGIGTLRRMTDVMLKAGKDREVLRMLRDIRGRTPSFTYENKMSIALSFAAYYSASGQPRLAEGYYLEGVESGGKTNLLGFHVFAWQSISRFYVSAGQHAKADPYLKRLAAARKQMMPRQRMEISLLHFRVDSALARYPSAIRHYQQYTALKDSLFSETQGKQVARLNIQYETEQKEQALKLREKNIALLTERSRAQQTQRNALVGGTALLLALLLLSYNRYRLKRRSNLRLLVQQQQLQDQQREINQKNEHLSQLLDEKDSLLMQKDKLLQEQERLLKEIHHRVKNNLQVVMSLLNLQADSLQDRAALSAIQESQHRVQAMALIHQKLYQSEGVARIPMDAYIEEMSAYLHDSFCRARPVRITLAVEPVELDVTLAVPVGLIINEALTNAFKYAFPGERAGTIRLSLHQLAPACYELVISDNGVGLPAHFDPARSRSLGMTLMHGFSGQLGSELSLVSPPGLTISLVFGEEQMRVIPATAAFAQ